MKVKLLSENARIPERADNGAAGYDVTCPEDFIVYPGRNLLKLDIAIQLNPGTEAHMRPRSGHSLKGMKGYCPEFDAVKTFDADVIQGTIDENYRGNVGVIIKSYEKSPFVIKAGTKVAQMVISQYFGQPFQVADELDDTSRGVCGFGSTEAK